MPDPKPRFFSVEDIDCDHLTHESPEEAIEHYLADGGSIADVDVHEYEPEDLPPEYIPAKATSLAETITEDWHDDGYGDPEHWDDDLEKELREELTKTLQRVLGKRQVWSCRKVGTTRWTAAQLRELREANDG